MLMYEGGDPDWFTNTSPQDMQKQMQMWEQWMQDLSEKGQLISGGDALVTGGKRLNAEGIVTDIAAAEFKDLVNGYSIISANNIDEAIEISKTCPAVLDEGTSVQIREIINME